jgi:signal peptide peptidase SppA
VAPKAWGEEFEVIFGPRKPEALFEECGPYAVVDVCGPLSQHAGWMGDSYDDIRERFASALESKQAAVCLKIDSPGGDWCGALELSRDLRAMADAAGKPLVAFTDGMALSAGYAIACAASEIVATESATVGSVGVWAPLIDVTAQDAMHGVRVSVAASGTAKADRNPHVGTTDEAFARLQAQVDEQAEIFFELVSEARGLPVSKIKALDGAELFGQRGVAAGLSDRLVNSWATFLSSVGSTSMKLKASKYDEAYGLLKQASEGDDEEAAKKAKKALKAMEDGEEEPEEKKDKEKAKASGDDDKDKKAKAASEDEEKKKAKAAADDEEKKAKAADEEKEKAKALASNSLALATEVAALRAKDAARDAAEAKAKADAELAALFAKRPDLSEAQRKALAAVPFEQAKALVDSWPRVTASPGSSAASMTPGVSGGERRSGASYEPRLTVEEQALLDASDPNRRSAASAGRGVMEGTQFHVPIYSPEGAKKRLAEIKAEREAG